MRVRHFTRLSFGVLLLGLLVGCVSPKQTVVPSMRIVDVPPLQVERTVELGDTMVSKGKIYTYHGIELKNQVQAGDGVFLLKFTIPPQRLTAKLEDKEWTYYVGDNVTSFDAMIGTRAVFGGLKISRRYGSTQEQPKNKPKPSHPDSIKSVSRVQTEEVFKPYAIFGNSTAVTFTPKPDPIFDFIEVNAMDRPSFTQELIYDGRSGDTVKFLYRELSHSMMRTPFTQEVQYDLKQGNVVGFKGVRIEILDATNTQLKYKVIASFPDAD